MQRNMLTISIQIIQRLRGLKGTKEKKVYLKFDESMDDRGFNLMQVISAQLRVIII